MSDSNHYTIEVDGKEMLKTDDIGKAVDAFRAWDEIGTVRMFCTHRMDLTNALKKQGEADD